MPSTEQYKGDKIWESPEIGLNALFLANLTAYFTRQNSNYGIKLDFGLAPKTYQDWRDLKTAEARQAFLLNRATMLRTWLSGMKNRLSEIKKGLKDENLSNEDKIKLALEMYEIDRQAAEMSKSLGIPYAGQLEHFSISRRD